MSKHVWTPKEEPPKRKPESGAEEMALDDFLIWILGRLYNIMIAVFMLFMVILCWAIVIFIGICAIVIFIRFVAFVSNPIPFVSQI